MMIGLGNCLVKVGGVETIQGGNSKFQMTDVLFVYNKRGDAIELFYFCLFVSQFPMEY